MKKGRNFWESPVTALTVMGDGISSESIRETLGIEGKSDIPASAAVYGGDRWWAIAVDENYSADVDEQVRELVRITTPLVDRFAELRRSGCTLHIDISGTVGTNDRLTVSPESLALLSRLSLPITFTTLANAEYFQEEDPLAWLDDL